MPIYEYQCQKCKKVHEIWQKMSEDPVKKCPSCGGKVDRIMSAVGFELKGGGWYKDGYASAAKEAPKSEASESKSETKAEAKSDASSGGDAKKPNSEKAEKAPEKKKFPITDPKHKSNSPVPALPVPSRKADKPDRKKT